MLFSSVIWSNTVKLLRFLSLLQFLCSIWCVIVSFCGFLFFFLLSFGNPVKKRCRGCSETVFCLNTFIVGFTLFCLFDFIFLENRQHVHSQSWCTKTLFTSYYRTDDIDMINNAIQQWKTMGKIPARGFVTRLYSATVPTVSRYGK